MICDFRWEPNRYEFKFKIVPDELTRCGCLVLFKTVETNCYGETRNEVFSEE